MENEWPTKTRRLIIKAISVFNEAGELRTPLTPDLKSVFFYSEIFRHPTIGEAAVVELDGMSYFVKVSDYKAATASWSSGTT